MLYFEEVILKKLGCGKLNYSLYSLGFLRYKLFGKEKDGKRIYRLRDLKEILESF